MTFLASTVSPTSTRAPKTPLIVNTDAARRFLADFMLKHFNDKTFTRYIERDLAGDFAFQLARCLARVAENAVMFNWISVEIGLPRTPAAGREASAYVLGAVLSNASEVLRWDRVCLCSDRLTWAVGGVVIEDWAPTHWAPLPELAVE